MAHELLKLKPVTNTELNIDGPVYKCRFLLLIPSLLALNPSSMEGRKKWIFISG